LRSTLIKNIKTPINVHDLLTKTKPLPLIIYLGDGANGQASIGKYAAGTISGAAGESNLFVAGHAY